jgi:bifunctional non-homologous end joining protein LigD
MAGELETYRKKRDATRTPEPVPADGQQPRGGDDTFVVQEHHATALHWDLRLERHGVLVSWAVPKGLPMDPSTNHLAVHTEDHPMQYASFEGEIPRGEYGGGQMSLWDRGTYETEKWTDSEVKFVLHGERARGRYVLFQTSGKNWMIHRMDKSEQGFEPLPKSLAPMLPVTRAHLPADDASWAYELQWGGARTVVYVDGGRPRAQAADNTDVTASYPELRDLAARLGARPVVLDGEIVAFDEHGKPDADRLASRSAVGDAVRSRRLARHTPVTYLVSDVLHLDGRSTQDLPYVERRRLLVSLALSGPRWQTTPSWAGGGVDVLRAAREQGLSGVLAKRLDSPYAPGRRSTMWLDIGAAPEITRQR